MVARRKLRNFTHDVSTSLGGLLGDGSSDSSVTSSNDNGLEVGHTHV